MRTTSRLILGAAILLGALLVAGCGGGGGKGRLGDSCSDDAQCESGLCVASVCVDPLGDADADGLTNALEAQLGSKLDDADSDADGVGDADELGAADAPTDSDEDGQPDILESRLADADGDCVVDERDANDAKADDDPSPMLAVVCAREGVCAEQEERLAVRCAEDGTAECVYSAVEGYGDETCDLRDNDCDGETDEGVPGCGPGGPRQLDVLWVVDDSASMCQEQVMVSDAIDGFVAALPGFDVRTAVVTTAALIPEKAGTFNLTHATEFPPLCQEERLFPAQSDLHCECAACAGWDEAYAYQCGQDSDPPEGVRGCPVGDPAATAPAYEQCLADGGCTADLLAAPPGRELTAADRARLADLAGLWVWEPPSGGVALTYNRNGSVNSTCQLNCGAGQTTVEDARTVGAEVCRDWFADETMICQAPDLQRTGCLIPPRTGGCPDDLPAVLPAYHADGTLQYGLTWFPCIATVGADQTTAGNLEQGLKQAWLALDASGPHPLQICDPNDPVLADPAKSDAQKRAECERVFLREDASLVIIFVTDEDDCSIADDKQISPEDYNRCALLGDAETEPLSDRNANTDERPLATVAEYAGKLQALKDDPADVYVAAVVGDAWDAAGDPNDVNGGFSPADVDAARALYFESKTERTNRLALNTSICTSELGRADLGLRYIRLVERFGERGFRGNICGPDWLGALLEGLSQPPAGE